MQTRDGPAAVEGVVVRIDEREIIFDLGSEHGLEAEQELELFRRIQVTHPVTGAQLQDRFPLGFLVPHQVGRILSIAHMSEELERTPAVGDFVVFSRRWHEPDSLDESVDADDHRGTQQDCGLPQSTNTSDQLAAETLFEETLGMPIPDRIGAWEDFLQENPHSPYAPSIGDEIVLLRRQLEEIREMSVPEEPPEPNRLRAYLSAATLVYADEPMDISAAVVEREFVQDVRLFIRRADAAGYQTIVMEAESSSNWHITLDDQWRSEGSYEYFVEAIRTNGATQLLSGSASAPNIIVVSEPERDLIQRDDRSRASSVFEFVDFRSGNGADHYWRFESDYRYDVDFGFFHTLGVGVGIFDGEGETLATLDAGGASQSRNVNYGFVEFDFEFLHSFSAGWRFLVGNQSRGDQETLGSIFGHMVQLRLGEEDGTRLELGGALTDELGNEAWTEFFIEAVERVPMSASVIVTNLPVGEDLGVSLNIGCGYRFTDWLVLMARAGLNARTIENFGFSTGLGTILNW